MAKNDEDETTNTQQPKQHDIAVKIVDLKKEVHTDQTGKLPNWSRKCNRYIMFSIHLDPNYIFFEPFKTCQDAQLIQAYKRIIERMKNAGLMIKKQILDNKASKAYKEPIVLEKITHELVPPGNHWLNVAKQFIQTFKEGIPECLETLAEEWQ